MLKRLTFLLFLGAAAWLIYPYLQQHFATASPAQKFSVYVDTHIEQVLGPVNARSPHFDTHTIQKLREDLLDHARNARPDEASAYSAALAICDTLTRAAEERNEVIGRINQLLTEIPLRAPSYDSPSQVEEKKNFFIANAERGWKDKASRYRAVISVNYAALRREERLH